MRCWKPLLPCLSRDKIIDRRLSSHISVFLQFNHSLDAYGERLSTSLIHLHGLSFSFEMDYSHFFHQELLLPEVLMKVNKIFKLLSSSYILLDVDFPVTIRPFFNSTRELGLVCLRCFICIDKIHFCWRESIL